MSYCVFVADHGPEVVEHRDDLESDRIAHPGRWDSEAEAHAALDAMAWIVLPWICCRCHKTRRTAAGTGEPAGWVWIDVDDPGPEVVGGKVLVCGPCGRGTTP